MSNSTVATTRKVSLGDKIAFGVGMFANQMFPAILGIFMVVLVQDLGFPGWMWGVLFFLPRVFDSITDPIMGFISDNTRSRWGRRRQYVLLGAIIMGFSFAIMWQLYREDGIDYNFTYFLLWSFVFYLGLTIFSVPYVAMGYEMSNDFHERTSIMAVAQWIGQWAWVIAPWFWVIMYDQNWFVSADVATRELAIWVGGICSLCAMVPAIFLKSRSTLHENYETLTFGSIGSSLKSILRGFADAFGIRQFRIICIATFFIFNAFNTIAAFSFFIIVWYLFNGDAGAAGVWPTLFGSLGALMTTFLVIPIVAWMSKKMGKKKAFMISQSISFIGYTMLWFLFVPGKPWMFVFALPFFSFGIGSLFTLMMSMTADVIDLDELKSGLRREGIFGAIYWWMVKFGFAIAGGLSGVIMTLVGFDSEASVQTDEAIFGLRAFYSGFPMLGTLVAIIVMRNYDVTEEKANEVRAELARRKKAMVPSSSSGSSTPSPLIDLRLIAPLQTDLKLTGKSEKGVESVFNGSLNKGIHGICFSPYAEGQTIGDTLSKGQIRKRMDTIAPYTQWVRSFSCTDGNEFIPKIAKERGLKTIVGAWLSSDPDKNEREIIALISLAKAGLVDIATVGNEVLLRGELSPEEIITNILRVKKATPNVIVGCVDTYNMLYENPKVADVSDVILSNCYPFWEGSDIEHASSYLQQMYELSAKVAQGKPVIITETGWPSNGEKVNKAHPSTINAMKYFVDVQNWSEEKGVDLFYFSSFDEPWKIHHEGDVGQRWGIWDKNEKLKY